MSILGWWRKRMAGRRTSYPSGALDESAITARVDLVRLEAYAEAAYEAMRESRPQHARGRFEEARDHFDRAIEAAQRAGMRILALRHTAPEADLAKADLVRTSLRETDLDDILRRLA